VRQVPPAQASTLHAEEGEGKPLIATLTIKKSKIGAHTNGKRKKGGGIGGKKGKLGYPRRGTKRGVARNSTMGKALKTNRKQGREESSEGPGKKGSIRQGIRRQKEETSPSKGREGTRVSQIGGRGCSAYRTGIETRKAGKKR